MLATLTLAAWSGVPAWAQSVRPVEENLGTISNSPFSRLGLGDEFLPGGSRNQALGGAGVGAPSGENVNLINPALLYYNRVANFEFTSRFGMRWVTDGKNTDRFSNWTPTNISITLPVARPVTVSVGLRQFSSVDYASTIRNNVANDPDTLPYTITNSGQGSLSHAYVAAGVHIFKGFSAGITGTYWFGTLSNRSVSSVQISEFNVVNADQTIRQRFSDVQFKPGVAWRGDLPGTKGTRLGLGFVTDIPTSLSTSNEALLQRTLSGFSTIVDTLYTNRAEQVKAPVTWQGGLMLERPYHYTLSADIGHTRWDKTQGLLTLPNLKNTFKAAIGFEYLPNYQSNRYVNLISYRFGLRWQQMPYAKDGRQLSDVSVSFGTGLPVLRKEGRYTRPFINLSLQAGRRGSIAKAGLVENYLNLGIGIILNDNLWFVRYKID